MGDLGELLDIFNKKLIKGLENKEIKGHLNNLFIQYEKKEKK